MGAVRWAVGCLFGWGSATNGKYIFLLWGSNVLHVCVDQGLLSETYVISTQVCEKIISEEVVGDSMLDLSPRLGPLSDSLYLNRKLLYDEYLSRGVVVWVTASISITILFKLV